MYSRPMANQTVVVKDFDEGGLLIGNPGDVLTCTGASGGKVWAPAPGGAVGSIPIPFSQMLYVDPASTAGVPDGAVPSAAGTGGPFVSAAAGIAATPGPTRWFNNVGGVDTVPAVLTAGSLTLFQGRNGYGDVSAPAATPCTILADSTTLGNVNVADQLTLIAANGSSMGTIAMGPSSFIEALGGTSTGKVTSGAQSQLLYIGGGAPNGWTTGADSTCVVDGVATGASLAAISLANNCTLFVAGKCSIESITAGLADAVRVFIDAGYKEEAPDALGFTKTNVCGPVDCPAGELRTSGVNWGDNVTVKSWKCVGGSTVGGKTFAVNGGNADIQDLTFLDPLTPCVFGFSAGDVYWRNQPSFPVGTTINNDPLFPLYVDATTARAMLANCAIANPAQVVVMGARRNIDSGTSALSAFGGGSASVLLGPFTLNGTLPSFDVYPSSAAPLTADLGISSEQAPDRLTCRLYRAIGDSSDVIRLYIENFGPDALTVNWAIYGQSPYV